MHNLLLKRWRCWTPWTWVSSSRRGIWLQSPGTQKFMILFINVFSYGRFKKSWTIYLFNCMSKRCILYPPDVEIDMTSLTYSNHLVTQEWYWKKIIKNYFFLDANVSWLDYGAIFWSQNCTKTQEHQVPNISSFVVVMLNRYSYQIFSS